MVWVGSDCGIVTDALAGTRQGQESECDYCSDGRCLQVAAGVSEYEVEGVLEEEDPRDTDEERVAALEVYRRVKDAEHAYSFGPEFLNLQGWRPTPEDE